MRLPMRSLIASLTLLVPVLPALAASLPLNEVPMYGEQAKTPENERADQQFIDEVLSKGVTRAEGARQVAQYGWQALAKNDVSTAIKRFNQAWLLDHDNASAYHGFAVVTLKRGGKAADIERYFSLAESKPGVEARTYADFGNYFLIKKNPEQALTQLTKAMELKPDAPMVRFGMSFAYMLKKDLPQACDWSRRAEQHGDALPKGYHDAVCGKG